MNIWKISIQNIKSKPLYTLLSVFVLSLSIALLLGIQQLKTSFKYQIENNLSNIDLVIGAKGSPLQLVLSSVLHIDTPTGNIPYKEAKKISKNPMIRSAVPISYGDNYKGYRIVGTTQKFISLYHADIKEGRTVKKNMEVVIGYNVAEKLNLKIGDTFLSSHGLAENNIDVHNDKLTVVGILKPTKKVIDGLIVTNLESIWDVHNHEKTNPHNDIEHQHNEKQKPLEDNKEITSLLISFRNPRALLTMPRKINKNTNMQAALPKYELDKLYEYTGVGFKTITAIAYIILIVSGLTIFISLYKMVKEQAFDLALLRTYGASNFQLIKIIIYEGLTLVCFAFILGLIFVKTSFYFVFNFLNTDHKLNIIQELPFLEILQTCGLVFVMITLAISLAIYPILKMDISTILSNEK